MSVEITITLKDEESRKLVREYLVYEPVTMDQSDPVIERCLNETLAEFKGKPDDVRIKALMVLS
jgi:hypothetical protein